MSSFMPEVKRLDFFLPLQNYQRTNCTDIFEQEIFVAEGESYCDITHLSSNKIGKVKYFLYIT